MIAACIVFGGIVVMDTNGDVIETYKTGRFYRITRSRLKEIL
jgi:hypothetical protein